MNISSILGHIALLSDQLRYLIPFESLGSSDSFPETLGDPTNRDKSYRRMYQYFLRKCPRQIKNHRNYFKQENRGFGEDAFHAMWWLLIAEYQPKSCLEIGVYRGQVISLWSLIAKMKGIELSISGISPFTPAGDAVSKYSSGLDFYKDTLDSFERFGLPPPNLLAAYSNDAKAVKFIEDRQWDLIYIDGSHDYEIALADYKTCIANLASNGLLVIDDSSLYTNYNPPRFAFKGHPGPSRIVSEYALNQLSFLGAVGHNNIFRKT